MADCLHIRCEVFPTCQIDPPADPTPPPVPASALPQPTQHAYRWGRACAETALDEEPELTHPGHLVRHRISDAAVEAVWPIAYAAGVAAGRTAAVADIRAEIVAGAAYEHIRAMNAAYEHAARIAEGEARG